MTAVIEAEGLGKRYRRQWALTDCTLSVPAGHVVGLVGLNGAGKTTLLNLATGMLAPTAGTIEVLGGRPAAGRGLPGSWPRSGTWPRTRGSTPGCRLPTTSGWARASTRAGTIRSRAAGSISSTWTPGARPGSSPAASARSSR